jgi:hypothetical protein
VLAQRIDELFLREALADLQLGDGAGDVAGQLAELPTGQAGLFAAAPQFGSKVLSDGGASSLRHNIAPC